MNKTLLDLAIDDAATAIMDTSTRAQVVEELYELVGKLGVVPDPDPPKVGDLIFYTGTETGGDWNRHRNYPSVVVSTNSATLAAMAVGVGTHAAPWSAPLRDVRVLSRASYTEEKA